MAKKQQIFYKWACDDDKESCSGPFRSVKEARAAAAAEAARDNSFSRLGVASVEVLVGPAVTIRCSVEDVDTVKGFLFEDIEEAVQNALGNLADGETEAYYATASPKSRAELLLFFKQWCPRHMEGDGVKLDPKRSKTYSIKIPQQPHSTPEDTAALEQHDIALAAVYTDLRQRLSSSGVAALQQLRQEIASLTSARIKAKR